MTATQKAALQEKASIAWRRLGVDWEMYLTLAGDRWREAFIPLLEGIITEQGTRLNSTYGMQFDVHNLFAEAWFDDYELKFAQDIMDTTKRDMSVLLQDGMNQGWSIPTMQKHIGMLFEQYMYGGLTGEAFDWFSERMPNYRRENIARTETMRASNAGKTALYQDWGVPQHEWIATGDGRTRDAHIAAHGQRVDVGTAFFVGGEYLMYPGDPAGSAANVCQCRCTTVAYNPMWELLDEEGVQQAQYIEGQWVEPGAAAQSGPTEDEWLRFIREHPGIVLDTPETTAARMQEWLDSGFPSGMDPYDGSGFAKNEIVTKLSEQTGIPYDDVNVFIKQWSESSNDNDMRSLAMQQDAAKMLGIDLPQWQADKLAHVLENQEKWLKMQMERGATREVAEEGMRRLHPDLFPLLDSDKQQQLLRAMYDNTQARLNEAGVGDTVRLRRGMTVSTDVINEWGRKAGVTLWPSGNYQAEELKLQDVEYRGSILESWSANDRTAGNFARMRGNDYGVVFEMDIPRERLIGSARTGYGCLGESEFVHLGGYGDEMAKIVEIIRR